MPKQRATLLKYSVQRAPYVRERGPYTRVRCARALACAKGWQSQCARGKPAAPAPSGLREDGCKFAPSRHAALGGCSKLSTVTLRRIFLRQADTASVIIYRACNSIYITSAPLAANDCCNATTANFSWSQWNCSSAAMQLNTDGKADANMNWQRPSQCEGSDSVA